MARRGQFGRISAGSSNLSDAIRSLVQQQKAQEESTFMNAFYNGTDFNGRIPTISDVIAFYEDIGNLAGIERGTTEWSAISQKIDAANNFDIKRTYNALITDFNNGGGENYADVINFLNTRATESTDAEDKASYSSAIASTTSSYVSLLANRLSENRISISDFRSIVDGALSRLDPSSEAYSTALNSAKIAEWNTEKGKKDNLLSAKKISYGEYAKWARDFRESILSSGVERGSTLDTAIQAAISVNASRASTAAASAAVDRARKGSGGDKASILNLYAIAATQSGVPVDPISLEKLSKGEPFTIEDVISNPEVIASYMRLVDSGVINIDERLVAAGLESGFDLRNFYDKEVTSLVYNARKVYASTGNQDDLAFFQKATKVYYRTGSASKIDEIADAATQFARDIQAAGLDDFLLGKAFNEWAAYLSPVLSGQDGVMTKYGVLTKDDLSRLVPPEFSQDQTILMSYLLNSASVALGQMVPTADQLTFEGAMDVTIVLDGKNFNIQEFYTGGSIQATAANIEGLLNGTKAQEVTVKDGVISKTPVPLPSIGPRGTVVGTNLAATSGRLNQISWKEVNGQYFPVLQSVVASNEIQVEGIDAMGNPALENWGWKYIMPDGSETFIKNDGTTYDRNPFDSVLTGSVETGILIPANGDSIKSGVSGSSGIPVIDVPSLYAANGGTNNPTTMRVLAEKLPEILADPNNQALLNMSQVIGEDLENAITSAVAEINLKADTVELNNLQLQSFRMAELGVDPFLQSTINARIAELRAKSFGGAYSDANSQANTSFLNFVVPNRDKYTETEPGVWTLKPEIRAEQTLSTWGPIAIGTSLGAAAGAPFGGVGAIPGAVGGFIAGLGQSLSTRGGEPDLPNVVNINPLKPLDYKIVGDTARTNYLGGTSPAASTPGSDYFRNMQALRPTPVATAKVLPTVSVSSPSSPKVSVNAADLALAKAYSLTAAGKADALRDAQVYKPGGPMVAK